MIFDTHTHLNVEELLVVRQKKLPWLLRWV